MKEVITGWLGKLLQVRTQDSEQARHGRLLGILLLGTICASLLVTMMHLVDWLILHSSADVRTYLLIDLAALGVLCILLRLNQTGQTKFASYTFLILVTMSAPAFEFGDLNRVALFYIVATGAASFFINPSASFLFAAISTASYTAAYAIGSPGTAYSFFLILILFMTALGTWLAATSLENTLRQVYQRADELERRVMERTKDLTDTLQREHAEATTTQAILRSIGDGVIVFDHAWKAVAANPAACVILNRHEADVIGKNVIRLMGDSVNPEDQAIICSLIDGQGSTQATLKVAWGGKTASLSFAPIKLPVTNRRGTVVVLRDVTKEAEVDQMKSEFVSLVSHELRTPMAAIKGYVDLLLTGSAGQVTDMQRNFLGIIKTNTDRLSDMVSELLDLSRIEAGKIQLHYTPISIDEVIREIAAMLQKSFDDRGIGLHLYIPDALPEVLADRGRLAQVVTNLLSNALKYTFEGWVDVAVKVTGEQIEVSVVDTGIGMTEQDQTKLFTRFFRASTARAREIPGTGLGLAITRSLVQMHGGGLSARSTLGQGSTFSFTLPILPDALSKMAPPRASAAVSQPQAPPKILIVEDELHIAQLFRHQLEMDGYNVTIVTRGSEALEQARRERPDLISLDVMLPDMSGFDVLRQIKADRDLSSIPIIVTSIVADTEKGFALGAADYITKPMDRQQLLTSVRRILAQQEQRSRHSLLVVEDDPDTRRGLLLALASNGFLVTEAEDGAQALASIAAQVPDLVLLDLRLPRLDGWTVIRRLKASPATAGIPVIVLTGDPVDPQRDKMRVFGMGVRQFLTKPVSVDLLIGEIRRQLLA